MTILCWFGWHKIRWLGQHNGFVKEGCDRCGKTRIVIVNPWGRPTARTGWE
jgi:hypothetical protein